MFNDKSTRPYIFLVRILAALLGLLQLAYFLLSWCFPEASQLGPVSVVFYPRGMEPGAVAGLTQGMRWTGILLALPALLLLGYALLRLDRMLRACTAGRMFALSTVAHMKAFIGCVLASLALGIVEPVLRTLVWRHGFGDPAKGFFSVGVSSEELTLLLICTLFFVVASLMHEARRIAEENEGFV
ncbi:DUF2975 domain-containing protein [Massilia sp. IC2-476]|uniref:DUF2975 domain-containing protein n=1 Tax=Massilia sp. IC2-476 TaxID=2887199 RepID=UPI001D0FC90C|nr:DUF2975 domain-containing protein [Massilia sp. IC2-476]MCC2971485.1 DUF2975 domain-containing protein [Massilia sp. IC2-476]